eukprot:CAMPEP_0174312684 /NCGR_PEP_ID=MMETSP0810-20121108/4440_1 /TAXON_ID=73025 ORGANISM="Eutreptiella gymnastica-like, Strain CCMP1594" /NCGR_SAMPLE_ID=MMETSP0810 /ASSEMBLY_ACC=CAM_ASM_000659 /LENGTH=83 /DNA_ID=CAMNT_0015421131 /DNA_START=45 /DNA_END=296 /DNA_ORIENTATION=+
MQCSKGGKGLNTPAKSPPRGVRSRSAPQDACKVVGVETPSSWGNHQSSRATPWGVLRGTQVSGGGVSGNVILQQRADEARGKW